MFREYHGESLYRTEYLPAVLVPIFIAVIEGGVFSLPLLAPIIGWALIGLGFNLMDDALDKNRKLQLERKALIILSIVAVVSGLILASSYNLAYAVLFVVIAASYAKLKKVPLLDTAVLVVAYCVVTYMAFAVLPRIATLAALVFGGLTCELLHDIADNDATFKKYRNGVVTLTIATSIAWMVVTIYLAASVGSFWTVAVAPVGLTLASIVYFRKKPQVWSQGKRLGAEIGKIIAVVLFAYMLMLA